MNALHPRCLPLLLILPAAVLCSCGSSKKKAPSGDAYASYPSDGRYNPYPAEGQNTKPRYQEYTEAPPPPAEEPEKPKAKAKGKPKSSSATASSDTTGASSKKSSAKKKPAATTAAKSGSTKSSGGGSVHVVKHGDTLYGLAKKYHSTVSKIKSANGLSSDVIRDGQKLKIP